MRVGVSNIRQVTTLKILRQNTPAPYSESPSIRFFTLTSTIVLQSVTRWEVCEGYVVRSSYLLTASLILFLW